MQIDNMTRLMLTDEEICNIADAVFLTPNGVIEFARAIESALIDKLREQEPDEEGIQVEEVEQVTLN